MKAGLKKITLPAILYFILSISCSKNSIDKTVNPVEENTTAFSSNANPIIGKWELGPYKSICGNSPDTVININTDGDFVEFMTNDTAYYTYNTTKATGWSPFKIVDNSTFILGDTMHIISFDGKNLTTFSISVSPAGFFSRQWTTYIKMD